MTTAFSPAETQQIIDRLMVQTQNYYVRDVFNIWIGELIPQLNLNRHIHLLRGEVTVRAIGEVKLLVMRVAIQNHEALSKASNQLSGIFGLFK